VEIIADYCAEVDQNVTSTFRELEEASDDLAECSGEFTECMLGQGLFDEPSNCIRDYGRCSKFGKRDQRQGCNAFLLEWGNDTRRAERSADFHDVEEGFLAFIFGDSPERDECLDGAQALARICFDELIDGD
jgi:hypothetical protein